MESALQRVARVFERQWRGRFSVGFVAGVVVSLGSLVLAQAHRWFLLRRLRLREKAALPSGDERHDAFVPVEMQRSGKVVNGISEVIGNTPLMKIESLSRLTDCEILGKAEFLNPGGSSKDRVALQIIDTAEEEGKLTPNTGSWIFEGKVGSTGISIAMLAKARGYNCCIIVPDDVSSEKAQLLRHLGAKVEAVRPRGIVDPRHFVNEAHTRAERWQPDAEHPDARAYFADQFETEANYLAHFYNTGPEIWEQTGGRIDAFVSGAGTGGTIAGTGAYLKKMTLAEQGDYVSDAPQPSTRPLPPVQVVAADPQGSGLFNRVKFGVLYSSTEAEGTRRRHQVDSIVEGIGINRLTHNLELGLEYIDTAERVTDQEAINMSRWLAVNDGLFLGSSSAVHCVAAVKTALKLKAKRQAKAGSSELADGATATSGPSMTKPVVVTILYVARHLI